MSSATVYTKRVIFLECSLSASDSADVLWPAGDSIGIVPDPLTVQGADDAIRVPSDYRISMVFKSVRNSTLCRSVRPYTNYRFTKA